MRGRSWAKAPLALLLILPLALGLAGCGGSSSSSSTPTPNPIPTSGTPDARADVVLGEMTQAEKLEMVQGGVTINQEWGYTIPLGAAGWVPGILRLNIPTLYLADGSVGVGNGVGPATALPSSIASAASWDTNEATKYGTIIGSELADYGINVKASSQHRVSSPRLSTCFRNGQEDLRTLANLATSWLSIHGIVLRYRIAFRSICSSLAGSRKAPCQRTAQRGSGPVTRPVAPLSFSRWPRATRWLSRT